MKTWFITGTSSGFGRELVEQLIDRGDRVAATARRPEVLDDVEKRAEGRLWRAVLDVTDTEAVRATFAAAIEESRRVDVVVSNAGYGLFGAAEELSDEQVDRQIATNLTASIQLGRAAIPHLREQGGGRIVQVASIGGQIAFPAMSLYHATKWGIEGFWEAAAAELAPFGIRVTIVEPGVARTNFGRASSDWAAPHAAYSDGPAGYFRGSATGKLPPIPAPGDPAKMAAAIIATAGDDAAPLRLTLGSDAWALGTEALRGRLNALVDAKDVAFSTDIDGFAPA